MPLRIGVAGVGFGTVIHIPAFQSEGVEVVAITARRKERAVAAAERFGVKDTFTDFNEMLAMPDLDAVSIVTPAGLHHEMAIAALRAGKHVLCEKPFAANLEQAQEMVEVAKNSDRTAMVAHEFRFSSGRSRMKELIDDGYLGAPQMGLVRVLRAPWNEAETELFQRIADGLPIDYRAERDNGAAGLGFLYSLGSHYVDGLLHWFGDVEEVQASLVTNGPERLSGGEKVIADADDTFFVNLRFVNGLIVQMMGSRVASFTSKFSIELYGHKGVLKTPQEGWNPPAHGTILGGKIGIDDDLSRLDIPERLEPFSDDRDNRMFPFRMLVREFLRGIADGTSPSPNFADGYRVQNVLEAIRTASNTRSTVKVPR